MITRLWRRHRRGAPAMLLVAAAIACGDDDAPSTSPGWRTLAEDLPEAATSVSGSSREDVYVVGADVGQGPLFLHYDGTSWSRIEWDAGVDLWWVHVVREGLAFVGGSRATVLRVEDGVPSRLPTPGLAKHTVYGVWARSADEVYAVGAARGRDGFIWRYDGSGWTELSLPTELQSPGVGRSPALFKVWGDEDEIWVVGALGTALRSTDGVEFEVVPTETRATLFTVHGAGDDVGIVGGGSQSVLLESGSVGLEDRGLTNAALLQGIFFSRESGRAIATGLSGRVFERRGDAWVEVDTGLAVGVESLHACWIDPEGGVWTVGGNVVSPALNGGVIVVSGVDAPDLPPRVVVQPPPPECPANEIDPVPDASMARRWIVQNLNAIRRDIPRPTVHARNLYHVSAALYDVWAAYDEVADQVFVDEKLSRPDDLDAARSTAMSYAAYRVLTHRYGSAVGGAVSSDCFDSFMAELGLDPNDTTLTGDSPVALGNRVGAAIIEFGRLDGANEANDYADPDGWQSPNAPLVVDGAGTQMNDPAIWQPLDLAVAVTQNGIPVGAGVQGYIGAHWRQVTPFALERPSPDAPYFDLGAGPGFDAEIIPQAVEVIQRTRELDLEDDVIIDISPASIGNNPLGTNDGSGYATNPFTGQPYDPILVNRGDFGRVIAEYWADGPKSETPPGHWNVIAHQAMAQPEFERRLEGTGEPLDPLEYDVKLHLALNGAEHDAAIVAWELKRLHVSARPISLIRYMAQLGQSSEPGASDYDPMGLPLVEGLIERITPDSSAPGARHHHLAPNEGELAVYSWRGEPGDPSEELGGVGWIRAVDWVPYQRDTFVSPAFPGYTSDHSTFSRAGAEVLTAVTGSEFFPGGLGQAILRRNEYLSFEQGPSTDIPLSFATYYDAADQAGQSRLWGGIHIRADDFDGRRTGREVGLRAFQRAKAYFDGTAR